MAGPPASGGRRPANRDDPVVITDALAGKSRELRTREKRYAITMAFRTACFVAMIFAPGALRWVLFGCAVFLPYIAVILANQAHERGVAGTVTPGAPLDAPQLTTGPEPEVIPGHTTDAGDHGREDRVA